MSQPESVAASVVSALSRDFEGRHCPQGRLTEAYVASVFHYGAVHIDPAHLVVWILLRGVPAEELPEWWRPDGSEAGSSDLACDEWLRQLTGEVRQRFEDANWPGSDRVTVLFDAAQRVEAEGGFNYFR